MDIETACKLCKRVREKNQGKWWTAAHWQCWGCEKYAKGDDKKRCFNCDNGKGGYDACPWVNKEAKSAK